MPRLEFSILCSRLAGVGRSRERLSGLLRNPGQFHKKSTHNPSELFRWVIEQWGLEPEQIARGFTDRPVKQVP